MQLKDGFGRQHDYLRISVTDRCNLRCLYCMGPEGIELMDHKEILTYEEIVKFVKALEPWGINKLRITGGEPLIRKGIENLIKELNKIPNIKDIALTTNGELLAPMVDKLKESGLKRVNISIDSLNPAKYKKITRRGTLKNVLKGIDAALEKRLLPVKLNVVLMKDINDGEIADFLKLTLDKELHVRFIEYMPLDSHDVLWSQRYLSLEVVKEQSEALGYRLEAIDGITGNNTAETWKIKGSKGSIGLIHPVSNHFCSSCTRLRLTADGRFKPCLYWNDEINVKEALNQPLLLASMITQGLQKKREKHMMSDNYFCHAQQQNSRGMAQIGG